MRFKMEIPEEIKTYSRNGSMLKVGIEKSIANLLLQERLKRRLTISEVGKKLDIDAVSIEKLEMYKGKFNFCLVALLLKFYQKQLTVDLKKDNTPVE